MPITDIIPLIQAHAWIPLAALVIGFVTRILKDDAFVLPPAWSVAARWRPVLVVALGVVSGVLDAIVGGTPWRDAIVGGLLSALLAMLGHTTIVDILRGGRDLGAAAPKPPLYQPPPPVSSDEPTLPRGPRGIAGIDALLAVCGALVILVMAQIVFGCAWLRNNGPEVIHVVDEIDHVCPAVALTLPEIGPVCVALDQAERILEILRLAALDKSAAHLRIGGRDLTVRAEDVGAVLAGVEGPVAAARGSR